VTISEWDPANSAKLQKVLDEWLSTRGLPTLHFLVEPDILGDLGDRRIFVAERNGEPIAFVTMAPVPTRRGWLTEQFVRGKHAPNGTIELTLDAAIRAVGESGAEMITMGIVPLSHRADSGVENPRWLRLLLAWVRAHGRRFYNFDGLESFKNKFHPDCWEPIYVISKEPRFSLSTLNAVAGAFTKGSPIIVVFRAMLRAFGQEIVWLFRRRH
jgi:phosphatidylglycerol lysyltransferase